MGLLARTQLPKIGLRDQTELASSPTGSFERILLPIIGLLGSNLKVLTCLLKLTLLSQISLPVLTELALTV